MEFIKDNLKLIIIIGVSIILLVIVIILFSKKGKKKNNSTIQNKPMNSEYKLQAKTVSIFEAINRETERQSGKTGISYVNDLQNTKTKPKNIIKEQKVEDTNVNPIQTSTDPVEAPTPVLEPPKEEVPIKKEEVKPVVETKDVLEPPKQDIPVETKDVLEPPKQDIPTQIKPAVETPKQDSVLEPPKAVVPQTPTLEPQPMEPPVAEEGSLEIHQNTFLNNQEIEDIQKPVVQTGPTLDVPIGTALSDINDEQK